MKFFSCWRSPTSLSPHFSRCLAKPCWTTTLLHHHHAVVLLLDGVFLNLSLSPCWIKAWETSPGCTCVNAEAPFFGAQIGINCDLNRYEYDSLIRVLATLPTRDLQRYEDALPSRC